MLITQKTNSCPDECERIMSCDKCDKKLCLLEEFQSDSKKMKVCKNVGYYLLGEKKVCTECRNKEWWLV